MEMKVKFKLYLDPWKWASLQQSKKPSIYAKVITCENCAHCVDLRAPTDNDSADLKTTRAYQLNSIKSSINKHWNNIN